MSSRLYIPRVVPTVEHKGVHSSFFGLKEYLGWDLINVAYHLMPRVAVISIITGWVVVF
jgi:hypothetical protein